MQSREAVARAAVLTHGRREAISDGLDRLRRVAEASGVELLLPEDEQAKHGAPDGAAAPEDADLVVVLGGDGTMLRALGRLLGTAVPVIGVNFGRVGFLSSIAADELETGLARAFAGEYEVVELPTLAVDADGSPRQAVNDVVARSSDVGRMVELGWSVGGEELGPQACDGIICATPVGSTAYNLSAGGPVLVWGLDAMAVTFVAPHSLHARPLVLPRGRDLTITNRTADVAVTVLVDGHPAAALDPGADVVVRIDDRRSLLASLPESTFFRRYHQTFAGGP
ncbi:MAG TPA: NAD(+)/NADH kinase [Gaiellaceae bacterium]|nr:NAD(+)/NADH kinase [Gaiellaceae bacterium]